MQRVSLFVASAFLLLTASCRDTADGGALQPATGVEATAPQWPETATFTPRSSQLLTPRSADPPTPTATEPTPTLAPPQPTATRTPHAFVSATATMTTAPTATATMTAAPTATATMTAVLTATATPIPTPTPIPQAVFVRSHTSYALGSQLVVVGELLNGAGYAVYALRVHGRFYDSGDALIASAEAQAALGELEIERVAPFRMIADIDPAVVHRYELSVSFEEISINEYRELEVSAVAVVERNGRLAVVGELHNGHETALSALVVAVTFYDEEGEVVEAAETALTEEVISPGADLSFEILLPDAGRAYSKLRVLAQGQLSLF